MLVVSGASMLAALSLAGLVMAHVLERFVTESLDRRLDGEISLLASAVDADGRIDGTRLRERLAAFEGGPDWNWRIVAPHETAGSPDFPQLDAGPPPPADARDPVRREHPRPLDGSRDDASVHARSVVLQTRAGPVTLTAAASRDVLRHPIRQALAPMLAALVALGALLSAAALVQLRLGLAPLRRLRAELAGIRAGTRDRVDEAQPAELQPLAAELNALAAENKAALATARQSAANLAHALKTPVAVLALDLRERPEQAAQVRRIDATIRHHLARARAAAVDRRTATPLGPAIADLAAALRRLHRDGAVAIETDIADRLSVAVDPRDLDELVGGLLDNAVRHARRRVTVAARADATDPRRVVLDVADDGPGIPAAERDRVVQAGVRLDERGDGHGFGLSIATELAALYGGALNLTDAAGGGLRVRLVLPAGA